jgi:hypothetical protein
MEFENDLYGLQHSVMIPPPAELQSQERSRRTQLSSILNHSDSSVIVMKSPVSVVYAVKGLTSIPSDSLPHQVSVSKLPFDAKISHTTVPWVGPNVYLRCLIKNTSDYKILWDPVNIVFDDTLVSVS